MPEAEQLTLEALESPGRVVGGKTHDQRGELVGDRWPAEIVLGIRPVPRGEAPLPTKQRLNSHAER